MERDATIVSTDTASVYFNSHAHVERDKNRFSKFVNIPISTHTLTWSVTDVGMIKIRVEGISTHTLTWSVTS